MSATIFEQIGVALAADPVRFWVERWERIELDAHEFGPLRVIRGPRCAIGQRGRSCASKFGPARHHYLGHLCRRLRIGVHIFSDRAVHWGAHQEGDLTRVGGS